MRRECSSLLVVIAQVVAILPGLGAFGALRAARGLRLVRAGAVVFRVLAVRGIAGEPGREYLRRNAAGLAFGIAGMTWITSAVAFTLVEDVGVDGRLESFFDALWWSTATITTVGYGDVYPVTGLGRVVGGLTMLVGISTFAVTTAKIAELLVRTGPQPPA